MSKVRASFFVCAGLLGLALLLPNPAAATWPSDPLVNVPLCTETREQYLPTIISDGVGGAIITWYDFRSGNYDADIYAQRISAGGIPQWTAGGVALCTAIGNQLVPTIISDGAGGAIVTWYDYRTDIDYDIYAQRISAGGIPQWAADGVALCTASEFQYNPTIAADGAGGAIVTWWDRRAGYGSTDIYAQRISAGGTVQWAVDGVALCTATGDQQYPTIVSDGAGGAIVTWHDSRNEPYSWDIYAQRISATGTIQWTANGVALCTATSEQSYPTIVADGAGGAIVTWQDARDNPDWNVYAQRISAGGAAQWTAGGVALGAAISYVFYPTITADGAGGAIVTWSDYRSGNADIYAQKISAAGTVQWTAGGAALCQYSDPQTVPTIVSDGAGGAVVTWSDSRLSGWSGVDIYAQKISAAGAIQWTWGGVALCTATGDQATPTILPDGSGGAIVTWWDRRAGYGNADIYAQRVEANGQLGGGAVGVPEVAAFSLRSYPNPFNPMTTIHFNLPSAGLVRLSIYDVAGRLIRTLVAADLPAGTHEAVWDGRDSTGRGAGSGSYLARLEFGGTVETVRMGLIR